jgi:hypothetical protein
MERDGCEPSQAVKETNPPAPLWAAPYAGPIQARQFFVIYENVGFYTETLSSGFPVYHGAGNSGYTSFPSLSSGGLSVNKTCIPKQVLLSSPEVFQTHASIHPRKYKKELTNELSRPISFAYPKSPAALSATARRTPLFFLGLSSPASSLKGRTRCRLAPSTKRFASARRTSTA